MHKVCKTNRIFIIKFNLKKKKVTIFNKNVTNIESLFLIFYIFVADYLSNKKYHSLGRGQHNSAE